MALLPQRALGQSGIKVSALGLGCMGLSGVYGATDDNEGITIIHAALDRGVTMLDSSDLYGNGHNEELIGKALAGSRRQGVIVATKFGNLGGKGGKFADGRPEFVIASCEASLKRLKMDVIDLYYQHRIDPNVPVEDTVGAMAKLKQQGKIRALALCEASPETIRRAHKVHPIAAVQNEYSLMYRQEGEETMATTRPLGIAFVPYSPLGRGMMTGHIADPTTLADSDSRKRHPRYAKDNLEHNKGLAQRIADVAKRKGCTPAQLALAWVLAQGDDVIPIPGTKKVPRLEENLAALNVKLSAAEVQEISGIAPPGAFKGTRYPEGQMASLYI